MKPHTPFLRKYILGDDKQQASDIEKRIAKMLAKVEQTSKEIDTKITEAIAKAVYPEALRVSSLRDPVRKIEVDGTTMYIISGDSLLDMLQKISREVSDHSERLRKLECKWDIKNV